MALSDKPEKYEFLDGLRAVAMLIVLVFHALTALPEQLIVEPGSLLALLQRYILHGQVGVVVFIVLSGYCLMIPVARSGDGNVRGGILTFFKRRALRILPAYYLILLISILAVFGMTQLSSRLHGRTGGYDEILSFRNIATHVLMVHNLWFDTAFKINGPMWSVATEWQIYIVFAVLLLPLWRKVGITTTLFIAIILGILPGLLLPVDSSLHWARPWYLGVFALGMFAATVEFRPDTPDIVFLRGAVRFITLPVGVLVFAIVLLTIHLLWGLGPTWAVDTLIGFSTSLLIAACMQTRRTADATVNRTILRIRHGLEHPALIAVASFSYTAYLVQHLIFKGTLTASSVFHLPVSSAVLVNIVVGIPAVLGISFFLAQFVERPFLSQSNRKDAGDLKAQPTHSSG